MSQWSDNVRKSFSEGDAIIYGGLTIPEGLVRYVDLPYDDKVPEMQKLDVYRPADKEGEKLPVIINVHGGGWVYGDKELYQWYTLPLALRGFATVNFTYRLAPEYKFPAALEDTNSVVHWVFAHADEYGLDTNNIFMVGDSAGGNYCSLYAEICTDPEYASKFDFKAPEGFVPNAVALNCAMYQVDMTDFPENLDRHLMMEDLHVNGATKEEMWMCDSTAHVTPAFPPAYIMTCTGDFLVGQPSLMVPKLIENSVPVNFRFVVDGDKPLGHVFHLQDIRNPVATSLNDEEIAFFRLYMK